MTAAARPFEILVRLIALVLLAASLACGGTASGHEVRPAYLQLTETAPGTFDVLFKTPMLGDLRLDLNVSFSEGMEALTPVLSRKTDNSAVQTWRVHARAGIAGQRLRILGLENTVSDTLLRVKFADGRSFVQRLTPAAPEVVIPETPTASGVVATYLWLGVEHILTGIDHLLFVLGLILLVPGSRQLVLAITAFTVAHSITLATATLGFVNVPPKPVEAVIALSIAFVALEAVHSRAGRQSIAARAPWIVAFGFGLLHGLGFAGALNETGLPEGHIPLALLFFNVGVEAGQLLFITAVLGSASIVRRIWWPAMRWATLVPPYVIGSLAMFWVFQRVAAF